MAYRINFTLHSNSYQPDAKYLECRLKWESSRQIASFSMGYRITPAKWSTEAQRCMPNSFHGPAKTPASEINAEIERYVQAAKTVFAGKPNPTRDEVVSLMRSELGRADVVGAPGVIAAYRIFCAEQASLKGWTRSTIAKMDVTGRHIEDSRLFARFIDIKPATLNKYLAYLRNDLKLTDTTAHRQIANLRWFLFWAEDKGWLRSAWRSFKPRFRQPEKPVIFLEWPELMRIWDYNDDKFPGRLAARDVFCFCAFTSLRYSDAHALTWTDVGEDAIRVTTQKTHDALVIELNKWSREVLRRRKGKNPVWVFPRTSNQALNRELKSLCKACKIDTPVRIVSYRGASRCDEVRPKHELIGTHAARRTFVVNALQMGISPTVVMQWTGHSDYKSMKPYIAVADSAKAKAMAGFDKLGKKKKK